MNDQRKAQPGGGRGEGDRKGQTSERHDIPPSTQQQIRAPPLLCGLLPWCGRGREGDSIGDRDAHATRLSP